MFIKIPPEWMSGKSLDSTKIRRASTTFGLREHIPNGLSNIAGETRIEKGRPQERKEDNKKGEQERHEYS